MGGSGWSGLRVVVAEAPFTAEIAPAFQGRKGDSISHLLSYVWKWKLCYGDETQVTDAGLLAKKDIPEYQFCFDGLYWIMWINTWFLNLVTKLNKGCSQQGN